jgi:septal ring factor EnvC (AmiA/AmiB activator)
LAPQSDRCGGRHDLGKPHPLRAGVIGAVLLSGLAVLPRTLPAHVALTEPAPSGRVEVDRPGEGHDRLERQRALQRTLRTRVATLAAETEALRAQDERTATVLRSQRAQARALEQQLDRLTPRLLARVAELDERRGQAAQVLAELAGRSRNQGLAPTIRARMLALSPVMLERLRSIEHGVAALRGDRDRIIERQDRIERSMAELAAAQRRVQQERAQKRLVQQAAANRLRVVEAEVRLLDQEQARLALDLLPDEGTMAARVEPQAGRVPAYPGGMRGASGQGVTSDERSAARTIPVGGGRQRTDGRAVAAAAPPDPTGASGLAIDRGGSRGFPATRSTTALRAELAASWPGTSRDAPGQAAPLDVAFSPDDGSLPTGAARARGAPPEPPILTVPAHLDGPGLIAQGGPEVLIPAAPGQAVAAAVAGRVAFAGSFKSYGLLLILEHEGEYHTLLWGFARLEVRQGDQVQVGRIVGIMDARGDDPPVLHVERRRRGRPINIAASSNGIQG